MYRDRKCRIKRALSSLSTGHVDIAIRTRLWPKQLVLIVVDAVGLDHGDELGALDWISAASLDPISERLQQLGDRDTGGWNGGADVGGGVCEF